MAVSAAPQTRRFEKRRLLRPYRRRLVERPPRAGGVRGILRVVRDTAGAFGGAPETSVNPWRPGRTYSSERQVRGHGRAKVRDGDKLQANCFRRRPMIYGGFSAIHRRRTFVSKLAFIEPRPVSVQIGKMIGCQAIDPRIGTDAGPGRLSNIRIRCEDYVAVILK